MADTPTWITGLQAIGGTLGALAAPAVAAIALYYQRKTNSEERNRQASEAREEREAQRKATRDAQIFYQRAECYIAVMRQVNLGINDVREISNVSGRVDAFASRAVRTLYWEWEQGRRHMTSESRLGAQDRLLKAIRAELVSDEPPPTAESTYSEETIP
jgi:hypothetical protein